MFIIASVVILDDPGLKKDAEEFYKYKDDYPEAGDIFGAVIDNKAKEAMMRFKRAMGNAHMCVWERGRCCKCNIFMF